MCTYGETRTRDTLPARVVLLRRDPCRIGVAVLVLDMPLIQPYMDRIYHICRHAMADARVGTCACHTLRINLSHDVVLNRLSVSCCMVEMSHECLMP